MKRQPIHSKMLAGPILGLEGNSRYSLIFVSSTLYETQDLKAYFSFLNEAIIKPCITVINLRTTFIYKFIFCAQLHHKSYAVHYTIFLGEAQLLNRFDESSWSFFVPGATQVPKVGFSSCNGNSKKLPQKQPNADYSMWERLYESHTQKGLDYAFHCTIMSGDQVYADPIWDNIPYFKKHKLLGWRTNKAIANHAISEADRIVLEAELEAFYESLYIESWGKPSIAKVLASIPSIMMWDDHDIFDGWGSQPPALQASPIFRIIYKIAKKYFEAFQIRGGNNASRISKHDYSLQLRFRNFEIFALDNRSHRTNTNVMSEEQFAQLEGYLRKKLFQNLPKALDSEKVLLLAIPVPIAHLNYKERAERLLRWHNPFNFRRSLNDDALDHWDHKNHSGQQKRLLDFIFSLADHVAPKYVHIISGDVHSAGAGRIVKEDADNVRIVNEFISSPIVYKPVGKIQQLILRYLSVQHSVVENYKIGIYQFGFDQKRPLTIYQRNFGCFFKYGTSSSKVFYTYENEAENDIPGQPCIYLRPNKKGLEPRYTKAFIYTDNDKMNDPNV